MRRLRVGVEPLFDQVGLILTFCARRAPRHRADVEEGALRGRHVALNRARRLPHAAQRQPQVERLRQERDRQQEADHHQQARIHQQAAVERGALLALAFALLRLGGQLRRALGRLDDADRNRRLLGGARLRGRRRDRRRWRRRRRCGGRRRRLRGGLWRRLRRRLGLPALLALLLRLGENRPGRDRCERQNQRERSAKSLQHATTFLNAPNRRVRNSV